jgi:RNA polymerase sigma-70 factor (ECF subfamily)
MPSDAAHDQVRDLYAGSYRRLVGVVALVAGSRAEAEECVQEAFLRLLNNWPKVERYDDPEAWVRQAAIRLLSNRLRKARNGTRAVLRLDPPRHADGPDGDRLDVERALEQLPLAQRQAIVLHHLVGLDVAQVARVLGVPTGTVKSRLTRARSALAPLLREETFHA